MFIQLIITLSILCATASAFQFAAPASSRQAVSVLQMFDNADLADLQQMSKLMAASMGAPVPPRVMQQPRRKTIMFGPQSMIRPMSDEEFFGAEVSSLFKQAAGKSIIGSGYNSFKIDLKENEERVEISADLPGFKKNEVRIEIKDHVLVISTEKCKATEPTTPSGDTAGEDTNTSPATPAEIETKAKAEPSESLKAACSDRFLMKERASFQGPTRRSIQLPKDCDEGNISATLEDGVLTVVVPRMAPQQPKVVIVQ